MYLVAHAFLKTAFKLVEIEKNELTSKSTTNGVY